MFDHFRDIAHHKLEDLDIVIENRKFHYISCAEKCYAVYDTSVNEECQSLQYSTGLRKILNRGKSIFSQNESLNTTNNTFLSHKQLCDKVAIVQNDKRELRLKLMNNIFKNSKLCASISIHERFMVLISENNVLRGSNHGSRLPRRTLFSDNGQLVVH